MIFNFVVQFYHFWEEWIKIFVRSDNFLLFQQYIFSFNFVYFALSQITYMYMIYVYHYNMALLSRQNNFPSPQMIKFNIQYKV